MAKHRRDRSSYANQNSSSIADVPRNHRSSLLRRRLSPRELRYESLEERFMLSISPAVHEEFFSQDTLTRAIQNAANLDNYTEANLAAVDRWVIGFSDANSFQQTLGNLGGNTRDETPFLQNSQIVQFTDQTDWQDVAATLGAADSVDFFYPLVARQQDPRLLPNDPFFTDQWHLQNTGQTLGTPGADANVVPAWDLATGSGVVVAIVDDGVQHTHPDLVNQYRADLSFDFNFNDADPIPDNAFDNHGTSVAGVAVADGNNSIGGSGSALNAELAGIRLISAPTTDVDEAAALSFQNDQIDIYNNSWGPADGFSFLAGPGPLTLSALSDGVNNGRDGLGNIFVWAGGNGLEFDDDVNYDGYANSRYTIAVGAIDHNGRQANYSEPGAPLLVTAHSGSAGAPGITTTDRTGTDGFNFDPGALDGDPQPHLDYTSTFDGTSSSAPVVSGVIALMLETNPELSYRDVQHVLVESAAMTDPGDADWTINSAGHEINHKYGFGAIDAESAVQLSANWNNVGPEVSLASTATPLDPFVFDNSNTGVTSTISLPAGVDSIEWVEVVFNASHTRPGDLEVILTSPAGTESVLAELHDDPTNAQYDNWRFTSARHWGESSGGDWTLQVRDLSEGEVGRFDSWELNVYGLTEPISAAGPKLIAVIPNIGEVVTGDEIRHVAPHELTFRFDENQIIDAETLIAVAEKAAGIQIVRAGQDGSLDDGSNVVITPGFIGIGDRPNEVIIRFAETLPDDLYRITIFGAEPDEDTDPTPLANSRGQLFNEGLDLTLDFELDLGAQVVAVVPQATGRDAGGNLTQARNEIVVYFNDDDLGPSATDSQFYELIFTNETASDADDVTFNPSSVVYDAASDSAVLTFETDGDGDPDNDDLADLGTGAYRLRIGSKYQPILTSTVSAAGEAGSSFATASSEELGELASLEIGSAPRSIVITGGTIEPTQYDLDYLLEWPGAVDEPGHRDLPDGSPLSSEDHFINNGSSPDTIFLDPLQPGLLLEEYPLTPFDKLAGVSEIEYNFQDEYGFDPFGNVLHNLITEVQKDRTREIFELLGNYVGIQFTETAAGGITVATGDVRAVPDITLTSGAPSVTVAAFVPLELGSESLVVVSNSQNWGTSPYGGEWFTTAMHGILHTLGLGHADDLPPLTIMAIDTDASPLPGVSVDGDESTDEDYGIGSSEMVFPGDHDIVHLQHMYRPDSNDIDLYQFTLETAGQFSADTIAERHDAFSPLDSVLTLYREIEEVDPSGRSVTRREILARNDDYYSEDSLVELTLEPGTYFLGVSSTGNSDYDPMIENSGVGGTTQGAYDLRVDFVPDVSEFIIDADNSSLFNVPSTFLDGDADGIPGGVFNFWFNVSEEENTLFVDKAGEGVQDGSKDNPFTTIPAALAAASRGDMVRIVGNNFANDDPLDPTSLQDNQAYEIGFDIFDFALQDGSRMEVPQGVTVVIDAGAVFKLRQANLDVGSSAQGIDRSEGVVQVLGTPVNEVYFTSFHNEAIGTDGEPFRDTLPAKGDWGGLVFRNNLDFDAERQVLETKGIFLQTINHANISYGGGVVTVNSTPDVFSPIHLIESRPTISFNTITQSADGAISADPNSFEDSQFQDYGATPTAVLSDSDDPDNDGTGLVGVVGTTAADGGNATVTLNLAGDHNDLTITANTASVGLEGVNVVFVADLAAGDQATATFEADQKLLSIDIDPMATTAQTVLAAINNEGSFSASLDDAMDVGNDGSGLVPFLGAIGTTGATIVLPGANNDLLLNDFTDDMGSPVSFNVVLAQTFAVGDEAIATRDDATLTLTIDIDPVATTASTVADAINRLETYTADYGRVGPDIHGNRLLDNSKNGVFVRIRTDFGQPLDELEVSARFDDTDIVHLVSENLIIAGTPGGPGPDPNSLATVARTDARLGIDPGIVVKLDGARIEAEIGSQFIAEGTNERQITFTGLLDNRYGAGGTFVTAEDPLGIGPQAGDWGGFYFAPLTQASIDHALITFAGGTTTIEGGFARFNPVEIHQSHTRIAHTAFVENLDGGATGDRNGRRPSDSSTVYVLGAQPIIADNLFRDNVGPVISIDANAMKSVINPDWGRTTGLLSIVGQHADNRGPLVRNNVLGNNEINGMKVRGGTLTTETVWDDVDIVHVLLDEIVVPNHHTFSGIRLQSNSTDSLVVKLSGASAGFTATGSPQEIDDRIGGTVQIVGVPGHPVVLTSLADDSVGAGRDPQNRTLLDTNNDGIDTFPNPGDWRSVKLDRLSNDRNVAVVNEREQAFGSTADINANPLIAQSIGDLAPFEKGGDENLRLGIDIHGFIRFDDPGDVDVYRFRAEAGTEVWLDIDRSTHALDSVVELLDANGVVLATSDDAVDEQNGIFDPQGLGRTMDRDVWLTKDYGTTNPRDAGMRLVLPGPAGEVRNYYVRVRSTVALGNLNVSQMFDGNLFNISDGSRDVTFELDSGPELRLDPPGAAHLRDGDTFVLSDGSDSRTLELNSGPVLVVSDIAALAAGDTFVIKDNSANAPVTFELVDGGAAVGEHVPIDIAGLASAEEVIAAIVDAIHNVEDLDVTANGYSPDEVEARISLTGDQFASPVIVASIQPTGDNNDMLISKVSSDATFEGINIAVDGSGTGNQAMVSFDSATSLLAITLDPTATTAATVVAAINATALFRAELDMRIEAANDGSGLIVDLGLLGTTAGPTSIAFEGDSSLSDSSHVEVVFEETDLPGAVLANIATAVNDTPLAISAGSGAATVPDPSGVPILVDRLTLHGASIVTISSVRITPDGDNNDLLITAPAPGTDLDDVDVVFVNSVASGDDALVSFDVDAGTLTVDVDPAATTATTVVTAINTEGTFSAALDTMAEFTNDGTGLFSNEGTLGTTAGKIDGVPVLSHVSGTETGVDPAHVPVVFTAADTDVPKIIAAAVVDARTRFGLLIVPRIMGEKVVLDAPHVELHTDSSPFIAVGPTKGAYQLQLRLRELQEYAGSTVRNASIHYATNGIELFGLPTHSPLLAELAEVETGNTIENSQSIGNLLDTDRATLLVAGNLAGPGDIDWYQFTVDVDKELTLPNDRSTEFPNASTVSNWPVMFDIDYADGMERPDVSIWVFDATGNLIYEGRDSNVVDDRPGPLEGPDVDNLERGTVGALDPTIGTILLQEGETYFVAVSGQDQQPTALDQALLRQEPIDSLFRIADDHVGENDLSLIDGRPFPDGESPWPYSTPLFPDLDLHADDFHLGDVVTYIITDQDLFTVDPFTGVLETDVTTDQPDGVLPGVLDAFFTYGDVAMRNDGQLFTFTSTTQAFGRDKNADAGIYARLDTGDARTFISEQDDGIVTFQILPDDTLEVLGDNNPVEEFGGVNFDAIVHEPGPMLEDRRVLAVGKVASGMAPSSGAFVDNLLYLFNPDGTARDHEAVALLNDGRDRVPTNIIPLAHLFTGVTIETAAATWTVEPRPQNAPNDGVDILDGATIAVLDENGDQLTFEFDAGVDIRLSPSGPRAVRDGDTFLLDDGTNTAFFEFDSGPVIVVGDISALVDGEVFSIQDNTVSDPEPNPPVTFEFRDTSIDGEVGPDNVAIEYDSTTGGPVLNVIGLIVEAINGADFNVVASGFAASATEGRISLTFDNEDPVIGQGIQLGDGVTGIRLEGDYGVSEFQHIRIPFEETQPEGDELDPDTLEVIVGGFGVNIVEIVEASLSQIDASFASRLHPMPDPDDPTMITCAGCPPQSLGDRLTFFHAINSDFQATFASATISLPNSANNFTITADHGGSSLNGVDVVFVDNSTTKIQVVSAADGALEDGLSLTIGDGTTTLVFELEDTGVGDGLAGGDVAVDFSDGFTADQMAAALQLAIEGSGLNLIVETMGDMVFLTPEFGTLMDAVAGTTPFTVDLVRGDQATILLDTAASPPTLFIGIDPAFTTAQTVIDALNAHGLFNAALVDANAAGDTLILPAGTVATLGAVASVSIDPTGTDNELMIVSATPTTDLCETLIDVDVVFGNGTAQGNEAIVTYDAASNRLSINVDPTATTADTVVDAVNAEGTFSAGLDFTVDPNNDGSGLIGDVGILGTTMLDSISATVVLGGENNDFSVETVLVDPDLVGIDVVLTVDPGTGDVATVTSQNDGAGLITDVGLVATASEFNASATANIALDGDDNDFTIVAADPALAGTEVVLQAAPGTGDVANVVIADIAGTLTMTISYDPAATTANTIVTAIGTEGTFTASLRLETLVIAYDPIATTANTVVDAIVAQGTLTAELSSTDAGNDGSGLIGIGFLTTDANSVVFATTAGGFGVESFTHWAGAFQRLSEHGIADTSDVTIPLFAADTSLDIAGRIAAAVNNASSTFLEFDTQAVFSGDATGTFVTFELIDNDPANLVVQSPLLTLDSQGPGGDISGMTFVGDTLYAVSDQGGLYTVLDPFSFGLIPEPPIDADDPIPPDRLLRVAGGPTLNFLTTVATLDASNQSQPVNFTGLAVGPQNVEGGRYAETLFATDGGGILYALNVNGTLEPIFLDGNTSVDTGVVGATGIDFSPIDYNLWHTTTHRGADPGHGVEIAPDGSRLPPLYPLSGAASFYFGLENADRGTGTPQPGADNFSFTNAELFDTFDVPGGAHGSLTTAPFSLVGYDPADAPTVYFTYLLDKEDAAEFDTARAFISSDGGAEWTLLDDLSGTGGQWLQDRINVGAFAGLDNLKLRFDFSTAGTMHVGDEQSLFPQAEFLTGAYLRGVPASALNDGDTFLIDDAQTFEFDLGHELVIPNVAGARIEDGEVFSIEDETGQVVVFEFDKDDTANSGPDAIVIGITDQDTTFQVVSAVVSAITGSTLSGLTVFDNGAKITLQGAAFVSQAGPASITVQGGNGAADLANIPVRIVPDMTADQVANAIAMQMDQFYSGLREFQAVDGFTLQPFTATLDSTEDDPHDGTGLLIPEGIVATTEAIALATVVLPGVNNDFRITAGPDPNNVDVEVIFVNDMAVGDAAIITFDAAAVPRTLTIDVDPDATTANTVVAAINDENAQGIIPFSAVLDASGDAANDGSGTIDAAVADTTVAQTALAASAISARGPRAVVLPGTNNDFIIDGADDTFAGIDILLMSVADLVDMPVVTYDDVAGTLTIEYDPVATNTLNVVDAINAEGTFTASLSLTDLANDGSFLISPQGPLATVVAVTSAMIAPTGDNNDFIIASVNVPVGLGTVDVVFVNGATMGDLAVVTLDEAGGELLIEVDPTATTANTVVAAINAAGQFSAVLDDSVESPNDGSGLIVDVGISGTTSFDRIAATLPQFGDNNDLTIVATITDPTPEQLDLLEGIQVLFFHAPFGDQAVTNFDDAAGTLTIIIDPSATTANSVVAAFGVDSSFTVSDGDTTFVLELENQNLADGVAAGNIPVFFDPDFTADEVAAAIVDAFNAANSSVATLSLDGDNNDLVITASRPGLDLDNIDILFVTDAATGDVAIVTFDADAGTLTIDFDPTATTATTVVDAINDANGLDPDATPFTAALDNSEGTGLISTFGTVATTADVAFAAVTPNGANNDLLITATPGTGLDGVDILFVNTLATGDQALISFNGSTLTIDVDPAATTANTVVDAIVNFGTFTASLDTTLETENDGSGLIADVGSLAVTMLAVSANVVLAGDNNDFILDDPTASLLGIDVVIVALRGKGDQAIVTFDDTAGTLTIGIDPLATAANTVVAAINDEGTFTATLDAAEENDGSGLVTPLGTVATTVDTVAATFTLLGDNNDFTMTTSMLPLGLGNIDVVFVNDMAVDDQAIVTLDLATSTLTIDIDPIATTANTVVAEINAEGSFSAELDASIDLNNDGTGLVSPLGTVSTTEGVLSAIVTPSGGNNDFSITSVVLPPGLGLVDIEFVNGVASGDQAIVTFDPTAGILTIDVDPVSTTAITIVDEINADGTFTAMLETTTDAVNDGSGMVVDVGNVAWTSLVAVTANVVLPGVNNDFMLDAVLPDANLVGMEIVLMGTAGLGDAAVVTLDVDAGTLTIEVDPLATTANTVVTEINAEGTFVATLDDTLDVGNDGSGLVVDLGSLGAGTTLVAVTANVPRAGASNDFSIEALVPSADLVGIDVVFVNTPGAGDVAVVTLDIPAGTLTIEIDPIATTANTVVQAIIDEGTFVATLDATSDRNNDGSGLVGVEATATIPDYINITVAAAGDVVTFDGPVVLLQGVEPIGFVPIGSVDDLGTFTSVKPDGSLLHVIGHTVFDPGPLFHSNVLPEDNPAPQPNDFNHFQDADPPLLNVNNALVRGQDNRHEGFFIDDLMIGFAERGEMVTGQTPDTGFTGVDPGLSILAGDYQLEIRRGTEFGLPLYRAFDTNDRLNQGITLTAPEPGDIFHGRSFSVTDGVTTAVFEFVDPVVESIVDGIPIEFNGSETAGEIADLVAEAINGVGALNMTASSIPSSNRIELFGAASASDIDIVVYGDVPNILAQQGSSQLLFPQGRLDVTSVTTNGNSLRDEILGTGITTVGDAVLISGQTSAGFWTDGVNSGILLTSGDANLAAPPNNADGSTGFASGLGDADLDVEFGFETMDTTSLEFQFESTGGDLFFEFVFASEEYNEFTNSIFNDVFGFFLDGVNIALIPGTDTAVSINNVNGGNPLGTDATNPEFFNNNDPDDFGQFTGLIGYDGFTDIFTAQALDLAPGVHTIKLVVSDAGDQVLDSGVFIKSGSFSDERPEVEVMPAFDVTLVPADKNDTNLLRDQGQTIIETNTIFNSSEYGIRFDAGIRDDQPHPGSVAPLREINTQRLVPGVTIENNVIAFGGDGGIFFSGDSNPDGTPVAAVPFGKIVNNSIFGGGGGTGIFASENVSPTILNNILAGLSTGIAVDASSATTVIGATVYKDNLINTVGVAPGGAFEATEVFLGPNDPLFIDPLNGNFYLAAGSQAIDSSLNALPDRPELTTVRAPLGIPPSPILAPERDAFGQLRSDDPEVATPPGLGLNVFKDRGAVDRVDFLGPVATLIVPLDNDAEGIDIEPSPNDVWIVGGQSLTEFDIQLNDSGIGIDDNTVTSETVELFRDGVLLSDQGLTPDDYSFRYDPTNNVIQLIPAAGIWADGSYRIQLDNSNDELVDGNLVAPILDLAANPIAPNQPAGTTEIFIQVGGLTDFGDAPESFLTLLPDGARHGLSDGFFLGADVDSERDGKPSPNADADGFDDGVTFDNSVSVVGLAQITVDASASGLLDAWFDFNGDGQWDDDELTEKIFSSELLVAGPNTLSFRVPGDAVVGESHARFRFSSSGGLAPGGSAVDGEVEDYLVQVDPPRWQNPLNPLDVNGDGEVLPQDALFLANFLFFNGQLPVPDGPGAPPFPVDPPPYFDVTGDGVVSILDGLLIRDFLRDPMTVSIEATDTVKPEGDTGETPATTFTFTLTRTGNTSGSTTVDFSVAGNGANPAEGADFAGGVLPSGTVTFDPTETTKVLEISVNGDADVEVDEDFIVTLDGASAPTIIATATAAGTIVNDDIILPRGETETSQPSSSNRSVVDNIMAQTNWAYDWEFVNGSASVVSHAEADTLDDVFAEFEDLNQLKDAGELVAVAGANRKDEIAG